MGSNISEKTQQYTCIVMAKNPEDELTTSPEMEMVWEVKGPGGYDSREIQRSRDYRLFHYTGL